MPKKLNLKYDGKEYSTLREFCREIGMGYDLIAQRISRAKKKGKSKIVIITEKELKFR